MGRITKHRCGKKKISKICSLAPNSSLIDFNINYLNTPIKMQRDFGHRKPDSNSTKFLSDSFATKVLFICSTIYLVRERTRGTEPTIRVFIRGRKGGIVQQVY